MKRLLLGLSLLSLAALPVLAQTPPPDPNATVTIDYNGHDIEIEPEKGPIQGCVVEKVTTETLDVTTVITHPLVVAHTSDDTWEVLGLATYDATGKNKGNDIGDCFYTSWES